MLETVKAAMVAQAIPLLGFVSLILITSLGAVIYRQKRSTASRRKASANQSALSLDSLHTAVTNLSLRLRETEQMVVLRNEDVKFSGVEKTSRSKALRLHRLGRPPEHIAESLQVPLADVRLLLKVHRLTMKSLSEATEPQRF